MYLKKIKFNLNLQFLIANYKFNFFENTLTLLFMYIKFKIRLTYFYLKKFNKSTFCDNILLLPVLNICPALENFLSAGTEVVVVDEVYLSIISLRMQHYLSLLFVTIHFLLLIGENSTCLCYYLNLLYMQVVLKLSIM